LCSRVLLAQGKTEEALSLLAKLEQRAEQAERWGHVIEIHTLQALVYHALGKDDAAYAKLQEALRRAEPEGYVRHFLDEGLALKEMLETFSSRRAPAYVGKLLEAFRNELPSAQPQSKPLQANVLIEHLVEPLNEREQTILRLLGARLSDKEIAKELSLSVNTIKWYDRNIYSKLGVSTRRQAINKGKELGLL
jgi:LuxR family maltose regulon positive regulatory protein